MDADNVVKDWAVVRERVRFINEGFAYATVEWLLTEHE